MKLAKQILFKAIKPLPANNYVGSSLTKHTNQLSNLYNSCYCQKVGATGHLWTLNHLLFTYMHTVQGSAWAETQWSSCWDSSMSIVQGQGQARGAEAERSSSWPEALGTRPSSAPQCALANPGKTCLIFFVASAMKVRQSQWDSHCCRITHKCTPK